jgi:diacylglycerol O-acyltransferase / wax synthase
MTMHPYYLMGQSYAGTLTITVIADPDHVPDLSVLAAALQAELDMLTSSSS